jgi:hypothetical protein
MIHKKLSFLLILMAAATQYCEAQINDFKDIFATCIPNKTIIMKRDGIESERTYLGRIKDDNKNAVYYVVKEFYTVQAAAIHYSHFNEWRADRDNQ